MYLISSRLYITTCLETLFWFSLICISTRKIWIGKYTEQDFHKWCSMAQWWPSIISFSLLMYDLWPRHLLLLMLKGTIKTSLGWYIVANIKLWQTCQENANHFRGLFSITILSLFIAYLYVHLFWAVQKLIHKSNAKSKTLSNMYLILIVSRWHYCLQEQNNQFVIGLILDKNGRFWNSLKCVLIYLWSFFPYLSTWRIFCWRIILMF